jgi:hypothetical protein
MLDLLGVSGGGTLGQSNAEQERPYLAALSGKDRAYKAGRLKSHGAGRESEGFVVPVKACKTTRWREGTLLWSCRRGGKREDMPETANNPSVKSATTLSAGYRCEPSVIHADKIRRRQGQPGDIPAKGRIPSDVGGRARHIKKIIVKPYAGKPHVRFERGLMETGRR